MAVNAVVFANRSNVISLRLLSGGLAQDLTSVSRMTLEVEGTVLDSDVHTSAFDWTTNATKGEVVLNLGSFLTTPTNGYVPAELTVYDPVYSNGLVWEVSCLNPNLMIHVCE